MSTAEPVLVPNALQRAVMHSLHVDARKAGRSIAMMQFAVLPNGVIVCTQPTQFPVLIYLDGHLEAVTATTPQTQRQVPIAADAAKCGNIAAES